MLEGVRKRLLEAGSAVLATLLVARRAPGPLAALRTLAAGLVLAVAGPLLRGRGRTLRVQVAGFEFDVDHTTDLQVLREVWCMRIYDTPVVSTPRVVLDVGANIGAAAAFFKHRWPSAVVHAVEPDPHAFAKLERNAARLDGVVLHRAAIGPEEGEVTLWSSAAAWVSSVVGPVGPGARPVTVRQRTLASLLDETGEVDLLKLDAEGAEFAVLRQLAGEPRVRALIAELHFDLVPDASVEAVLEDLAGFDVDLRGDPSRRMEISARRRADASVS